MEGVSRNRNVFIMRRFKIYLICQILFFSQFSYGQDSDALTLVGKTGPQQISEKILLPAMGDWYHIFRYHYKFLHWMRLKITLPMDPNETRNYAEFKAYANLIQNETHIMDSFVLGIAQSLNVKPETIVLSFGLLKQGDFVIDPVENQGRQLHDPAKYWYRYPDMTTSVNDFYDARPPPFLFGKFYPQLLSELDNKHFLPEIIRLASVEGSKLAKTQELERQQRADAEAAQILRLEQERLAKIKADSDRKVAEAEYARQQDLERRKRQAEERRQNEEYFAELNRIDQIGPSKCKMVKSISKTIQEEVGKRYKLDPTSVRLERSDYVPARDVVMRYGFSKGPPGSPVCSLMLYTQREPVRCITNYASNVNYFTANTCDYLD